ncbi:hypothetical protein, conserved [Eimeria acervulina]|uniref:Derlin n=1 Tax=Eimeria acervulina TaxID=5801 RepID=U6GYP3_EIMAC|nr:hypothetical protein, conserved [Eimeria acervulina]CDI83629.1 hypothetical protein, conserved [Eimeria acervulina]
MRRGSLQPRVRLLLLQLLQLLLLLQQQQGSCRLLVSSRGASSQTFGVTSTTGKAAATAAGAAAATAAGGAPATTAAAKGDSRIAAFLGPRCSSSEALEEDGESAAAAAAAAGSELQRRGLSCLGFMGGWSRSAHMQQQQQQQQQQGFLRSLLSCGAVKSVWGGCRRAFGVYMQVPLVTRCWISGSLLLSLLAAGESALLPAETLCMHWGRCIRSFEAWRPFTAAMFQGPLSFNTLTRVYAAYEVIRQLESSERQALLQQPCSNPHKLSPGRRRMLQQQQQLLLQQQRQLQRLWSSNNPQAFAAAAAAASGSAHLLQFLLLQCLLLAAASSKLGMPFYGSSLTAAAVYVLSKHTPNRLVQLSFGVRMPHWALPFSLAAIDVLQQQQLKAAVPVLLGILTGHIFYLLKKVVPEKTGIQALPFPSLTYRLLLQHKARAAAAPAAAPTFRSKYL